MSVVTYNSAHCMETLFESLYAQRGISWELFVADNRSSDGTAAWLKQRATGNVTLNSCNLGYGRAHNQNLSRFRGRHVLFLNPDVTLPAELFAGLVDFLDAHPEVGVVGPRVLEGTYHTPFLPRRFYPGERTVPLEPGLQRDYYAWLSGCCLMIRRPVLELIDGFDPDYFLYQEETDLCLRVRRAGYQIAWCPEWTVIHAHKQSQVGLPEYDQERRLLDGTILFWQKHFSASDLPNIVRFQYLRARILLLFNGCGAVRRDHLRAVCDACGEWLACRGYGVSLLNASGGRIAFRQLHILMEWIRRGTFPMDDY